MTRVSLRIAVVALGLSVLPASGQTANRAPARTGPDKTADRRSGPPVIGCLSLANYRMLMHNGAQAAAAQLADPKADHLGCAALSRADITGIVDRVSLGGQSYDCAGLRATTACHWIEAGAADRSGPAGR
ncbi:hypothetical protein SAMN05216360_11667 [Methylobacterium phyllostachyos]|uniref:HdeA/HdeB family protein n=1 Tax=Methylobacterium phyllostachyos TaxID=582672 RepID=A0A1H0HLS3_9HYPH|nr:hypothetical protein [Methylobacterium phyllostachyos]SDO19983.1 hypothetical protein SAMN05216360_11667 [Methylobacterium phyllostachyos]